MDTTSYVIAQGLFVRLLGVVYFAAFCSLLVQVKGLYGSRGILPIADLVRQNEEVLGRRRFWTFPTLFWWSSSDRMLVGTAVVGIVASLLCFGGVFASLMLLICWVCYLSFCSMGQEFLSYQWDVLLLEAGFAAIFFALETPPSAIMLFVFWVLVFRLNFSSGVVKFTSRDQTWRDLTGMSYHYFTQPLPVRLAWYLHQLPLWFQKVSTALTHFLEVIVPLGLFAPPPIRTISVALLAFLQLLIMTTGNYAFFNLLSLVLLVPLVDDSVWGALGSWGALGETSVPESLHYSIAGVGGILLFFHLLQLVRLFYNDPFALRLLYRVSAYSITSGYGLFAVMTTKRYEIVVEGSRDGLTWKAYEFRWKPQQLNAPPRLVAPHQPRLDWQMWFAALSSYPREFWFQKFLHRLLEGSPEVLALLKTNPFPDEPPRYVRAMAYDYQYTDWSTGRKTGNWWRREGGWPYAPVLEKEL